MGWRLTWKFLVSILVVLAIVMSINIVSFIMGVSRVVRDTSVGKEIFKEGVSIIELTRGFKEYIYHEDGVIQITPDGQEILSKEDLWIQIINESGAAVYGYNTPEEVMIKYTLFDIVHLYKYGGVMGEGYHVFLGEKYLEKSRYSYIIGAPIRKVDKTVVTYTDKGLLDGIKTFLISSIFVSVFSAVVMGYILSIGITRPMEKIISYIERLKDGDYSVYVKPRGVYKEVQHNVNNLAQTLEESSQERKKNEKFRDEWISNISHDIKTPLASIKGYAEILEDDYPMDTQEVNEYADVIQKKADYIANLVDDLNLSSKLKHNKSFVKKEKFELKVIVRDTIIEILNDPVYSSRDISFDACEQDVYVIGDKKLLRRAVENLIYNALKHNPKDTDIDVFLDNKKDKVEIIIRDNGVGMSDEDREKIFQRYYRGTNTRDKEGSGLGMAISKEIIEANDGTIGITSVLGEGTEIRIKLRNT